jgi:hypothetical protein
MPGGTLEIDLRRVDPVAIVRHNPMEVPLHVGEGSCAPSAMMSDA